MVKRWYASHSMERGVWMEEVHPSRDPEEGHYVLHADYAAQSALLAEAREALEALEPDLCTDAETKDYAALNDGRASHWHVVSLKARAVLAKLKEIK